MALQGRRQIDRIALGDGTNITAYENHDLDVDVVRDVRYWTDAQGQKRSRVRFEWLRFSLNLEYAKVVSSSGTLVDNVHFFNTMRQSGFGYIYPIYSINPGVAYEVQLDESNSNSLLSVTDTIFSPSISLELITYQPISQIPTWLKSFEAHE